jgi:hypothetical protein
MSIGKLFAATALATTGVLGAGIAQAHEAQVSWSVTIGSPVYSVPVPAPVVVRPAPVYAPAPVAVYPVPVYARGYRQPTRWDVDGDGIPNRYDHVYNPRWDRNGNGIPDGREGHDVRHHDRDHDGIPDRYERR